MSCECPELQLGFPNACSTIHPHVVPSLPTGLTATSLACTPQVFCGHQSATLTMPAALAAHMSPLLRSLVSLTHHCLFSSSLFRRQLATDMRLEADLLLRRRSPSDAQLWDSTAGAAREPETQELSLHLLPGPIEVHPVQYAVLPG